MADLTTIEVAEFLAVDPGEVQAIQGGEWSRAFGTSDRIIRFGDHPVDFAKDEIAFRFSSEALPIPRILDRGEFGCHHYCISERKFGKLIDDLDSSGMRSIVPAVLDAFDAMRRADLRSTEGYGIWDESMRAPFGKWSDFLLSADEESERVFGWHDQMANSPFGDGDFRFGFNCLKSLLGACPNERYLLHTDLLHFNVLVDGARLSGVLDWGNAMYGDFLYELALFTFYAPYYPAMIGIDWAAEAKNDFHESRILIPDFDRRVLAYEVHIALANMAYTAFKGRWSDFEWNVYRLRQRLSATH